LKGVDEMVILPLSKVMETKIYTIVHFSIMNGYCPVMSRHGNLVRCLGVRCEWFDEKRGCCSIKAIRMRE